ncbi:MAG: class I SAM-dependent methyltransferase [Thermodesulfobacteriota bacterium]
MSNRTISVTDDIYHYILSTSLREPDVLRRLREETKRDPYHQMQISPEQGQFMALLIRLIGAERAIEIGVYTGYSGLWTALALPPSGRLIACDISKQWTDVARRYWKEAGVEKKIDLRLGPALDTLDRLLAEGRAGAFDFAFIDADKENYDAYYERCLALLRPGGLIAIDNTLWDGRVTAPDPGDDETMAIDALNAKLRKDKRIDLSLVPIGDGLTLVWKRP